MNNEICNAIDKLAEKFGIAVNWGNENIVPYIQDLMARYSSYKVTSLIISISFAVISIIFSLISMSLAFKKLQYDKKHNLIKEDELSTDEIKLLVFGIIVVVMCILATGSMCSLFQWIYIPDFMFAKTILQMMQ